MEEGYTKLPRYIEILKQLQNEVELERKAEMKKEKTTRITIRLPLKEFYFLEEKAKKEKSSVSELIRKAINLTYIKK